MSWKCLCGTFNEDSWARCIGCDEEFKDEYKIMDVDKHPFITSGNNIIPTIKIEPIYGVNIKQRIYGFLFGFLTSLFVLILILCFPPWGKLVVNSWVEVIYGALICGIVGFLMGNKYNSQIKKIWNRYFIE